MSNGSRFVLPYQTVINNTGVPLPGALLYFYASGTDTPLNTYSDVGLTTPNANPVVADAAGVFGNIFLSSAAYKVVLKDSNLDEIWTADPVFGIGVSVVGAYYGFATTTDLLAAFAAGVVLADGTQASTTGRTTEGGPGGSAFYYNASDTTTADNGGTVRVDGQGRRWYAMNLNGVVSAALYGAIGNGVVDDTVAIQSALNSGYSSVYLPSGTYKTTLELTRPSGVRLFGDGPLQSIISASHNGIIISTTPMVITDDGGNSIDTIGITNAVGFNSSKGVALANLVHCNFNNLWIYGAGNYNQAPGGGGSGPVIGMQMDFVQFSSFYGMLVTDCTGSAVIMASTSSADGSNQNNFKRMNIDYCNRGFVIAAPGSLIASIEDLAVQSNTTPVEISDGQQIIFNRLYLEANTNSVSLLGGDDIIFNNTMNVSAIQFINTSSFGATRVQIKDLYDLNNGGYLIDPNVTIDIDGNNTTGGRLPDVTANTVKTVTVNLPPRGGYVEVSFGINGLANSGNGTLKLAISGNFTVAAQYTVTEIVRSAVPNIAISAVTKHDNYLTFTITADVTQPAEVRYILSASGVASKDGTLETRVSIA